MKQVFPRFCSPVNPKEPASQELPQTERMKLEFVIPPEPFIITEEPQQELAMVECCAALSSFFPSLHLKESDNPYTCNSNGICTKSYKNLQLLELVNQNDINHKNGSQ